MRSRFGLFGAVAAVASMILSSCTPAIGTATSVSGQNSIARKQPNVIVIMADDLGYADISTYGINRIPTPNIDRIGKQGAIFTDGYASAPVCSPARAAMQTGRYQQRYGFEFNNGPASRDESEGLGLDVDEITIAQALKGVGYHTGIIGKWHLGSREQFYPTNRGYDEFVGINVGATSYIDPTRDDVIVANLKADGGPEAPRRTRFSQVIEGPQRTVVDNYQTYLTDDFGDRAAGFVTRRAAAANPYFLYLAFTAPHDPLMVTRKYYDRFPNIKTEHHRIYAAMVSALDDNVGKVIDAVEASGENDNTIIYMISDNGCAAYYPGMCACEPLRGGKLSHYEGGVRIPYLMRWPAKIDAGTIKRDPVSTMDIFPTVLAAAGAKLPADRVYDGVDLMPYLAGRAKAPHDALMWRRQPMVSIRSGDWKMWKHMDGKFLYLFNLKSDPNETQNLATANPAKVKQLENALAQWSKDLQDPRWPSRPPVTYDVCGTPFELPV